jgi:hypothetical protein
MIENKRTKYPIFCTCCTIPIQLLNKDIAYNHTTRRQLKMQTNNNNKHKSSDSSNNKSSNSFNKKARSSKSIGNSFFTDAILHILINNVINNDFKTDKLHQGVNIHCLDWFSLVLDVSNVEGNLLFNLKVTNR